MSGRADWRGGAQAIAAMLCGMLAMPSAPGMAAQNGEPTGLNLVIVEAGGAVNNMRQRVTREPIVRVEDENHKPVAGAAVTFLLPENGGGATFAEGAKTLTVTTGANGQAVARGFQVAKAAGKFHLEVRATLGAKSASATIVHANAAAGAATAGAVSGKLIAAVIAVAAAGATAGAVAATRHGSSSSTTVLMPGTPSVGGPH